MRTLPSMRTLPALVLTGLLVAVVGPSPQRNKHPPAALSSSVAINFGRCRSIQHRSPESAWTRALEDHRRWQRLGSLLVPTAKKRRKSAADSASRRVQRLLDDEEEVNWELVRQEEKEAKERQIQAMRMARAAAKGLIPAPGVGSDPHQAVHSPKELGIEDFGKARIVQWFPGHIAKAEKALKEQLKMVDVVIEVRDSRCPLATEHPKLGEWTQHKNRLLAINRMEAITSADREKWTKYFRLAGMEPYWTNGKEGKGIEELLRAAIDLSKPVNEARKNRGLLPRAPRVVIVGYPNVGKSALINRLTKKRAVESAPKVGVTRQLRWVRLGTKMDNPNDGIDLLDTPGLLPMRQEDQFAAQKLAMCNEIGEASYLASVVAEEMIALINSTHGERFLSRLGERYSLEPPQSRDTIHRFTEDVAAKLFKGELEMAGRRILQDFQIGKFGPIALEYPSESDLRRADEDPNF